jgi:hypothetical protein
VPTDPFVAPDPDARPRQQQNLPPGVALPPAAHWRADRPGDLGPAQPEGELFGKPGPNVGYAYTLVQRAKESFRVGPHEHIDDAASVVAELAGRRAAMYGRAPVMPDVERAKLILGYDGSAEHDFVEVRTRLVHEAGHDYHRRRALVDAVPEEFLRSANTDFAGLLDDWRTTLRDRLESDAAARS